MQTDKQDGKCLTESSNKVVLAYETTQQQHLRQMRLFRQESHSGPDGLDLFIK